MRKLILAASAVSFMLSVPLATVTMAQDTTTVIKKDDGDSSKTIIKKDEPFGEKKVIIHKDDE
jgi:hypothetical protein